ncbi:MAG: membrane protein insertase YidC [Oscillospiraceae bacterium]|nr:membrane protein insertase YidC [Oscillospiraceae bacterium]
MKKTLALILALLMLLALAGCAVNGTTAADDATAGMAPAEAAEAALDTTQDKMSISDIVRVPFGYLLDWLDRFANNYGVALILFSLIVKLVLLPMSIKGKKSMLKMSRLAPMAKALEEKYGDDKQKYQVALSQLYKDEGVSMGGGCLWSFIPLLILLPLYYVIREPITYMMHNSRSIAAAVVAYIQASGAELGGNAYYAQLSAAGHLGEFLDELKALPILEGAKLREISFSFIGIDLASIPTFQFWKWENPTWSQIGLFLIPLFSGGFQMLSMFISQKMNNKVATNADGEQDEAAAKTANQTNTTMMLMMPLMSLWIGYSMPAAISIYWIAQAVFGAIQDYFLTVHFRKVYDEEDAIRQELAAKRRAEEDEKERQRALRREQNPDGITDNISKKKLKQQEKEAAAAAAREYEAKKNPAAASEKEEKKPLSGDASRPYAKGRAYDPNHYGKKASAADTDTKTEE